LLGFLFSLPFALILKTHQKSMLCIGMIGGILPDIDLLLQDISIVEHRSITHSFELWITWVLGISIILIILQNNKKLKKKETIQLMPIGFSLTWLSHLITDFSFVDYNYQSFSGSIFKKSFIWNISEGELLIIDNYCLLILGVIIFIYLYVTIL